ncbi:unnamed protein product, partial [Brassica rapa subsp. trilocularis]
TKKNITELVSSIYSFDLLFNKPLCCLNFIYFFIFFSKASEILDSP